MDVHVQTTVANDLAVVLYAEQLAVSPVFMHFFNISPIFLTAKSVTVFLSDSNGKCNTANLGIFFA